MTSRCLALTSLVIPAVAMAQTPSTGVLEYRGTITDATGKFLQVTSKANFTFTLHSAPSSGTLLWSETQSRIWIQDGVFDVRLGASVPIDPSMLTADLWLEVTYLLMSPGATPVTIPYRLQIGSAAKAMDAQRLQGLAATGLRPGGPCPRGR